jgi:hypothetical protein
VTETTMTDAPVTMTSAGALVAIARAARLTGDRDLERAARQLLRDEHGIEISFRRRPTGAPERVPAA